MLLYTECVHVSKAYLNTTPNRVCTANSFLLTLVQLRRKLPGGEGIEPHGGVWELETNVLSATRVRLSVFEDGDDDTSMHLVLVRVQDAQLEFVWASPLVSITRFEPSKFAQFPV